LTKSQGKISWKLFIANFMSRVFGRLLQAAWYRLFLSNVLRMKSWTFFRRICTEIYSVMVTRGRRQSSAAWLGVPRIVRDISGCLECWTVVTLIMKYILIDYLLITQGNACCQLRGTTLELHLPYYMTVDDDGTTKYHSYIRSCDICLHAAHGKLATHRNRIFELLIRI